MDMENKSVETEEVASVDGVVGFTYGHILLLIVLTVVTTTVIGFTYKYSLYRSDVNQRVLQEDDAYYNKQWEDNKKANKACEANGYTKYSYSYDKEQYVHTYCELYSSGGVLLKKDEVDFDILMGQK